MDLGSAMSKGKSQAAVPGSMAGKVFRVIAVALLLGGILAACSDTPQSFGRPYRGRSLDVSVVDLQRLPVLQYSNQYAGAGVTHHRVAPTQGGYELVLVRLQVANYTATSHLVNIDGQAAELRPFLAGEQPYPPVDVAKQGESWSRNESGWGWFGNENLPTDLNEVVRNDVPNPPNWDPRDVRVIEIGEAGTPPGQGFLAGAYELQQGFGIDGWMVFEAPMGTKLRHIRWQAGDTITIPLS